MQYTIPLSKYIARIDTLQHEIHYSMKYIARIDTLQHEIHYSMKYIARIDTLQHENLLKGTNNLARSHKQSFIVFIPRL